MEKQFTAFANSSFVVGRGSLAFLRQLGKKRVAVVYDGRVVNQAVHNRIRTLVEEGGGQCRFVADIRNEPYFEDIRRAADEMEQFAPDLILAVGGGSVMDTAKAMHLFYEYPQLTMEEALRPFTLPPLGNKAVLVAVPTTSGTGSETTSAAVFIQQQTKEKHLMLSNNLIPAYAVLDADFTDSLPSSIAAHTGMDALTHAMEAAVCKNAHGMVVSIALGAALDLLENLEASVLPQQAPQRRAQARETCHIAASLAGVVITNSFAGLAHAMDQPGPYFGLPHGMVCGLLLPYTTAFASPHPVYATLARRLGLRGANDAARCQALVDHLWEFNARLGIPHSFAQQGIPEKEYLEKLDDFAALAAGSPSAHLSPRAPEVQQARRLLEDAYYGRKPRVNA